MEKRKRKEKKEAITSKIKTSREFSAGGAVCKETDKGVLWLIINPKGTDRWQLPKGRIEKGESSQNAAMREVSEEGGVDVETVTKIGDQNYFFYANGMRIFKTVTFYLMFYKGDRKDGFDKKEVEEVKFTDFKDSVSLLSFKNDKEILEKASEIVNRGIQNNLI